MKSGVVHLAGAYEDGIQHCIVCGEVLVDDTRVLMEVSENGALRPAGGFPPGPVSVYGNTRAACDDPDLPKCSPV